MSIVDALHRPAAGLLTRLADEELLVGHVLTSIAGFGPELEVNLAISSIGQDELGHSRMWHILVRGVEREAVNAAIWERPVETDYRVSPLAAAYTEDWAECVVKHVLYDTADRARLALLADAGDDAVRAAVAKMEVEERYHVDFWTTWLSTTTRADPARVHAALDRLCPLAVTLFDAADADQIGVPADAWAAAHDAWRAELGGLLAPLGLRARWDGPQVDLSGDLARIGAELQYVYREAPGRW